MPKIQVIIGSVREGRNAENVARWVQQALTERGSFEVEVLDLKEWVLPHFAETFATIGDMADPTYSEPVVRAWNKKLAEADGYVFITPEYNHSVPGVLKNAIDSVFVSWALRNKPAAIVGYSIGPIGGARAVEHLAHILIEAEAVSLRNTLLVGNVETAFDAEGQPTQAATRVATRILLEDLEWWVDALGKARAGGEHGPGTLRFRGYLAEVAAG